MKNLNKDNLIGSTWIGKVVDNIDPLQQGRCRVQVVGKYDELLVEDIPWAIPFGQMVNAGGESKGFGSISIPKKDTWVYIVFINGDKTSPAWTGIANMNEAMKSELSSSYENAHVLLYDEDQDLKVIHTESSGFDIFFKGSHININPDTSITIEHSDTSAIIELVGDSINVTANSTVDITTTNNVDINSAEVNVDGIKTNIGAAPNFSAVMGEPLFTFLKALAAQSDAKWPPTPGAMSAAAAAAEIASTSKTVKTSL
jgi:hypothetical protein